jgi:uncharacterized protein (TIGR02231 family)
MKTAAWLIAVSLSALSANAEVEKMPVKSKISRVTLYRSQALITRDISVPDKTGELALVIEKLPPSIVPGSLFASSKDLKVRSVRYLTELIPQKLPTDKIAQLEAKIKKANVIKATIATKLNLLETKKSYLENIKRQYISKLGPSRTAVTKEKIAISGFDFDSITKMTEFVFKQEELITSEKLKLADDTRELDALIKKNEEELKALRYGSPETMRQQRQVANKNIVHKAIIYVAKLRPGKSDLSFSYLVNSAGWSPAYNMRISGKSDKLNLEYLAHVRQLSREDWNGVSLTLSTATPNMNAEIPMLAPMWVALTKSSPKHSSISKMKFNWLAKNVQSQQATISQYRQRASKSNMDYNIALNSGAWNRQKLELSNNKRVLLCWSEGVRKLEQQMAVEYKIPDTVTLASRDDNQMVQIFSKSLDCSLYYEAVPLLAGYVSRGVESKNTINQPLLAGRYSAFIDGQYVGAGYVPVTATGQTLNLGFGIDPQLRCRRELVDKVADKSWGSRTESYKYSLILDNYKSVPVKIRLLDRIPVTKNKELQITLKDGENKLSKDADYREFDLPKGILRWDITLPANSSGARATKLDYSFDMKFDSDMQISGFGNQVKEQLRSELIKLKVRRQRK